MATRTFLILVPDVDELEVKEFDSEAELRTAVSKLMFRDSSCSGPFMLTIEEGGIGEVAWDSIVIEEEDDDDA